MVSYFTSATRPEIIEQLQRISSSLRRVPPEVKREECDEGMSVGLRMDEVVIDFKRY
jgi:hypothetical protein